LLEQKDDLTEDFWREELANLESVSLLGPSLLPGPEAANPGISVAAISLPYPLVECLHAYATAHGVSLRSIMLGVWAVLLSRYTRQNDVLFGIVTAGRPGEFSKAESRTEAARAETIMIGPIASIAPLRLQVHADDLLPAWLKDVEDREMKVASRQYVPLTQIQEWANWEAGSPLFDHVFCFVEDMPATKGGALQSESIEFEPGIQLYGMPFAIAVHSSGKGISIQSGCTRSDIERQTLVRLLTHYQQLLKDMAGSDEQAIAESYESGAVTVGA
jgi:non-ribosomal peptide synthetase component F